MTDTLPTIRVDREKIKAKIRMLQSQVGHLRIILDCLEELKEFEVTETMTDTLPTESQVAEHQRRLSKFPYSYGLSACALGEGPLWRATLRGFGGVTLWSGQLFADWIDANASTVAMARKLVAAKLREVRKSPRPPKIPRLHQRQPWRWPLESENVRNWRGMQAAWGIKARDERRCSSSQMPSHAETQPKLLR